MELYEIVMKLTGQVQPTGDHGSDVKRLENLKALTGLVDALLVEIVEAASAADRQEASMRAIGKRAKNFLQDCLDTLTTK